MSADIVLVTAWRRPEFLFHCLQNLSRARGIMEHDIWICEDNHTNGEPSPDNRRVVENFPTLRWAIRTIAAHQYWGNNHNVLLAYESALRTDARYVYLVEEDVMVGEDFFHWHRAVQERENPFCSIGVRHGDTYPPAEFAAHPGGYYVLNHYASLGVCFRREMLSLLQPWFDNTDYLSGLYNYLDKEFPNSMHRGGNGAQDGLVCRLMERHGLRAVYPTRPRAFHAGWYGYNRSMGPQPQGTIHERIAAVGRNLADPEFMAQQVADCQPCDLKAVPWNGELIEWKR